MSKSVAPNLLKYMEDMNSFFNQEKETENQIVERNEMVIFKEDWKRVKYYTNRMEKKAEGLPASKRKLELAALSASINYMLSKFEVIDTDKFLKTSLEQRIA